MPRDSTALIDDVRTSLKRAGLACGDRAVVGLSGGVDSLTLTHILVTLRDAGEGPALHAVHVDHGLRPESPADAAAVERLAGELGVPVDVVRVDVRAWESGRGLEAAARDARHAALASLASRHDAGWILLGHTLDDQAETVLLRLSRGTSLDGLSGIREISTRTIPVKPDRGTSVDVKILRPLIGTRRSAIETYAQDYGLQPVEDESNADLRFRRNAIRHQILPLIEGIVPGAVESIVRTAGLLQADDDLISREASIAAQDVVETVEACPALNRDRFGVLAVALQRRVVVGVIHSLTNGLDLTSERVEAVRLAAIDGAVSSVIEIAGEFAAYVDYDRIVFGRSGEITSALRRAAARPVLSPGSFVELNDDGTFMLWPAWKLDFMMGSARDWVLRTRQPGDRIRLASGRSQRLQDWFVNQRVPAYLRDYVPLLVQDGTIRWVIGFSTSDFEDVDSGVTARLREQTVEDQQNAQCHSKNSAS